MMFSDYANRENLRCESNMTILCQALNKERCNDYLERGLIDDELLSGARVPSNEGEDIV